LSTIVAELTGLPIREVNCGLSTSSFDLIGRFIGLGKENWVDGLLTQWLRKGGIMYLDEANMMKQDVATRLNPVLDTRGHLVLNEKDSEDIERHKYGYMIISMNPAHRRIHGTKPLNAAHAPPNGRLDQLRLPQRSETIRPQRSIEMLQKRTKIDKDVAYKIIQAGAELRRQYKSGDLPYGPSLGDLINWGTLVFDGYTPMIAAEETIIGLTSDNP
jgi:nitric oxide reductase NorQ protein